MIIRGVMLVSVFVLISICILYPKESSKDVFSMLPSDMRKTFADNAFVSKICFYHVLIVISMILGILLFLIME